MLNLFYLNQTKVFQVTWVFQWDVVGFNQFAHLALVLDDGSWVLSDQDTNHSVFEVSQESQLEEILEVSKTIYQ